MHMKTMSVGRLVFVIALVSAVWPCGARRTEECDWLGNCKPIPPPTLASVVGDFLGGLFVLAIICTLVTIGRVILKGVAFGSIIIGVLVSLTGIGAVIGFPMILWGSVVMCCCMEQPRTVDVKVYHRNDRNDMLPQIHQ